jgi:hypothetical protein
MTAEEIRERIRWLSKTLELLERKPSPEETRH